MNVFVWKLRLPSESSELRRWYSINNESSNTLECDDTERTFHKEANMPKEHNHMLYRSQEKHA